MNSMFMAYANEQARMPLFIPSCVLDVYENKEEGRD